MYSLMSSSESSGNRNSEGQVDDQVEKGNPPSDSITKENGGKKNLLSNRKQTLSKAIYQAARISGYRSQERKGDSEMINDAMSDAKSDASEMRPVRKVTDPLSVVDLSDTSELHYFSRITQACSFLLHFQHLFREGNGYYYTVQGGMEFPFQHRIGV